MAISSENNSEPSSQAVVNSPVNDLGNPKDRIGDTKPDLALVPSALSIYVAEVMKLGKQKYGAFNWRSNPVRRMVYLAAALRHITQAIDGADYDEESGLPHEAHAAACMGIALDAIALGNAIDDRPTKGAASQLIKEFTKKAA
jgi:hypothetical protein